MGFTGRLLGTLAIAGASFLLILTSFNPEAEQTGAVPAPQALPGPSSTEVPKETRVRLKAAYGKLPLHFEPNQGQADPQANFLSRGNGYTLFLSPNEAVLALRRRQGKLDWLSPRASADRDKTAKMKTTVIRMRLLGASPTPEVSGLEKLPGKSNYLIGNDRSKWHTNIPHYAKVKYEGIYPGIDLVYYGNQRQLEYDFVVAPGADPNTIRLSFEGSEAVALDEDGNLVLRIDGGEVIFRAPLTYQEVDSERREIAVSYALNDQREVSFKVAAYDASRPLIIDPVLFYSTYLGGDNDDVGYSIAIDGAGNAYITGRTDSGPAFPFPTTAGALEEDPVASPDVFVSKINPTGTALVYSTYLGGSGADEAFGIALIPGCLFLCEAFVTGGTDGGGAPDFPTTGGAFDETYNGGTADVFVSKLNAAGSALLYSTFIGGSELDAGFGIAVDAAGKAYVTGEAGDGFPTTAGARDTSHNGGLDAFVTVLKADGSGPLVYSTFLGGTGDDEGLAIAVDGEGKAYVVGDTEDDTTDFPTTGGAFDTSHNGLFDGFVAKVNPVGGGASDLVFSTFLGGSSDDVGFGLPVDRAGIALEPGCPSACEAYVTGGTKSGGDPFPVSFPTTPGAFDVAIGGASDAFVTKLNPTGTALVYSTYLGGSDIEVGPVTEEFGFAIAVDSDGSAYVTGGTKSGDFPLLLPIDATFGGCCEAFVTKLLPDGSGLVYSTFLGGSGGDVKAPEGGFGIAVDGAGSAYVTGRTDSPTFPTTSIQDFVGFGLLSDAFVAKIATASGHFLCYRVKITKGTPKFEKREVLLDDQFEEDKSFRVRRPETLCNPATKNAEVPEDLDTHLVGYKIKRAKGQPKHERQFFIKVENQFPTIFVDTKKPDRLLVPSAKDLGSTPLAPEFDSHNVDHFKCYKIKRTKNTPKFEPIEVTLDDQFDDTPKDFLVKKPTRLCTPVDKDGEGIKNLDLHLMCYQVRRAGGEPKHERLKGIIRVNNQFGPLQLDTRRAKELCVPSTKTQILP